MFMPPSIVTLSIAATRIHRSLIDYASGRTEQYDITASFSTLTAHCDRYGRPSDPISLQESGQIKWKGNTAPVKFAPPNRMEVFINRTYELDQTTQTIQFGSLTSIEGQSFEKPTGQPRIDKNTENAGGAGGAGLPTQLP